MAVRFSADAQDYTRTVSLGTVSQFSVICWVKISTDRNTNSTVWTIDNGNADYYAVATNSDGTTMKFFTESNASGNAQNFTVGTWYCVATSINGVNGSMWTRAITDTSWTSITWSNGTANTTGTTFRIGEHPGTGLWLNGAVAAMKVWNGVTLTLADFEAEAWQYRPKRVSNLVAWFPFFEAGTADYSGNGWTLSGGSGTSTEDGPPIPISSADHSVFLSLAPPTVTSTLDGTLPAITGSFTGAAKVSGTVAGTLPAITGSLTGAVEVHSTLAGTLPAITGSLTGAVEVHASLSATLPAITGSLTGALKIPSTLAGTLPAITGSLSGSVEVHASLSAILPAITGSALGEVRVSGTLAGTLPSITGSLTGTVGFGIRGLTVHITGIGVVGYSPLGPALERTVQGASVERVSTGPAITVVTLTGPATISHVTTGPGTQREITGPEVATEIIGIGV